MAGHRHKDRYGKWTTTDEAEAHPADALTSAEVTGLKALLAAPGGGGGTTPPPVPVPIPPTPPSVATQPVGLVVVSGDTVVNLSWSAPLNDGGSAITGYKVFRGGIQIATPSGTTYTNTGLTNGQTYSYQVRAVNSVGDSPPSSTVNGYPVSPPASGPFLGFAAANAAVAAGGTVNVPAGTYAEKAALTKPGVTWELATGAAVNLTGLGVAIQQAGISADGADITFRGGRIYGSSGAAFRGQGDRVKLINTELDHNIEQGYVWHGVDGLIQGGSNHHNNESGQLWDSSEQGSGKAVAKRLVIDGVYVHHIGQGGANASAGQGLWWDSIPPNLSSLAEVKNCRIEDVFYAGIMFEISVGGKFHDNIVARCGTTPSGSGFWGSGLLFSSSQDGEAWNNLFYANQSGVRCVLQNRGDRPGITRNFYVHDNTFIANTHHDIAYDTDDAAAQATMFGATSGNKLFANRFDAPKVYWKPSGTLTTLAAINALPGGGQSTVLTSGEKAAILAAAGY